MSPWLWRCLGTAFDTFFWIVAISWSQLLARVWIGPKLSSSTLTQNRKTIALRMLTTMLVYHVWGPSWIEIYWNGIWLRPQSHVTSHCTWGPVTTLLHDCGGVLGRPLDTFFWALTISWSRLLARVWSDPETHSVPQHRHTSDCLTDMLSSLRRKLCRSQSSSSSSSSSFYANTWTSLTRPDFDWKCTRKHGDFKVVLKAITREGGR